MLPEIPSKVHKLLQKNQTNMWYQDEISLSEHRLVGTFQFVKIGKIIIKYTNIIEENQWKELENEVWNKVINASDSIEVVTLGR